MNMMEIKVLSAVYEYPILYDTAHPGFKNVKQKDLVWEQLAAALDITPELMKKRWKNLRDCYRKHLRCEASGSQESKLLERYRSWPWADRMSVFKPFLKNEPTSLLLQNDTYCISISNPPDSAGNGGNEGYALSEIHVEPDHYMSEPETQLTPDFGIREPGEIKEEFIEDAEPSPMVEYDGPTQPKRQRTLQPSEDPDQTSSLDKLLQYLNRKQEEHDDVDLLLLGYARTIKKLSLQRQAIVKFKISKLLMQEELAQIKENSKSNCSSPNSE